MPYTNDMPNVPPLLASPVVASSPADMTTRDINITSPAPSGLNDASVADVNVTRGARRSARLSAIALAHNGEPLAHRTSTSENKSPPSRTRIIIKTKSRPIATRRKRKAARCFESLYSREEVASLQEEIFAHMDDDERKEYRGWVELESEPAFFNAMLQDLGATAFNVQEVVSLEPEIMANLPQPVYGFLFLFECGPIKQREKDHKEPDTLWFANQTTANACATVAVMNIIMNAPPTVKLGPELEAFREATRSLPPPYRGHALSNSDFIRAAHNSVARRIDLLSQDLVLDWNSNISFEKFQAAAETAAKKRQTAKSKKQGYGPSSYHYIAFIPDDDGELWELDGLQDAPTCHGANLGKKDDWTAAARRIVEVYMADKNDELISYNLLAICQSPLVTLSHDIATNLASAKALDDIASRNPSWHINTLWSDVSDDKLASFNLTRERICADFRPDMSRAAGLLELCPATARDWAAELRDKQALLEKQYAAATAAVADNVMMIHDCRRRDYTPAIHEWVRILAEKGVLHGLIKETNASGWERGA